jgi:hypothetical protein
MFKLYRSQVLESNSAYPMTAHLTDVEIHSAGLTVLLGHLTGVQMQQFLPTVLVFNSDGAYPTV